MTTVSLVASEPERDLARLFRRHYDHLVSYAATMVGAEDAVDIVHDALLKFYKKVETDGALPDAAAQRTLIFAMVHDCAHDHERRTRIKGKVMQLVSGATAAMRRWSTTPRQEEDTEIARIVNPAVQSLRPSWRQVVTLVCEQELEVSEVATIMNINKATVRAHLVRATAALQFQLTQAQMTPERVQRRKR
jgi:RNA polymerase sigma-70 factor (ECF subfamily)